MTTNSASVLFRATAALMVRRLSLKKFINVFFFLLFKSQCKLLLLFFFFLLSCFDSFWNPPQACNRSWHAVHSCRRWNARRGAIGKKPAAQTSSVSFFSPSLVLCQNFLCAVPRMGSLFSFIFLKLQEKKIEVKKIFFFLFKVSGVWWLL